MVDVEIFRAELTAASQAAQTATGDLTMQVADLQSEETGVKNPDSRATLRLELHRRLSALHTEALKRAISGAELSATTRAIADSFTQLDEELTGPETP